MSRDTLINLIDPDPEQPRKVFDEVALAELAASMAANGLAVPILLRPAPEGRYVIVHGERRWRAAQRLSWETIPAEVRELSPDEAHWISLVENVQRADLSPIEEARAYQARLAQGLTQAQLAQRVGKNRSYIAQKLRLLTLPAPVVVYLERRALREGHARQLLKLRQWLGEDLEITCAEQTVSAVAAPRSHIDAGFRAWGEEINARGLKVPSWESVAFWRATIAVHEQQSVAELAADLDAWYLDLCLAICYVDRRRNAAGRAIPPSYAEKPEANKLWWTMWGVLRGAGLLSPTLERSLPDWLRRNAYERVEAYQTAQQN